MSAPVIFIVDDDAAVRDSLVMLLRLAGHYVEAFESAVRFLSDARPKSGDCLIADIRMPEMDGLTLQQELLRRGSSLPVIIVTGHGDVPLSVVGWRESLAAPEAFFLIPESRRPGTDSLIIHCASPLH